MLWSMSRMYHGRSINIPSSIFFKHSNETLCSFVIFRINQQQNWCYEFYEKNCSLYNRHPILSDWNVVELEWYIQLPHLKLWLVTRNFFMWIYLSIRYKNISKRKHLLVLLWPSFFIFTGNLEEPKWFLSFFEFASVHKWSWLLMKIK